MLRRALGISSALLLALSAWSFRGYVKDDAYISFRFGRNLLHGHGLSFNPGEAPVEGYSNPSWVVVFALLDMVGAFHEVWSA